MELFETESKSESTDFDSFLKKIKEETVRKRILIVETVSIFLTITACIVSGLLALKDFSTVALAVSIDSLLDILAYFIVMWRYLRPNELDSTKRDQRAQILLSFIFFLSAFCIEFESIKNLVSDYKPLPSHNYIFISIAQSLTFSTLSIFKFVLCQQIRFNSSLFASGINSLVASLSSFSMALSMTFFVYNPSIWWLDSVFGLVIGLLVFIYGSELFFLNIFDLH